MTGLHSPPLYETVAWSARTPQISSKMSVLSGVAVIFSFCLAALGIMWQLLSASVPLFTKSWVRNTFEGTIGDFTAPIWPVKLIILIGSAMLIVQLVISAVIAAHAVYSGRGLEAKTTA